MVLGAASGVQTEVGASAVKAPPMETTGEMAVVLEAAAADLAAAVVSFLISRSLIVSKLKKSVLPRMY